ncbi:MAG: polysaccharide deacetylase family protein [Peptococcia bacterium]
MQRKHKALLALVITGVIGAVIYYSGYQLRLVPNEPDLRPNADKPKPQELTQEFELKGGSERDNRGFPQREILDLASMFPNSFFREGDTTEKRVALTFDDGPDSVYTPQMLDVLKEHEVKATFFYIGNRAQLFPEVIQRTVQEGHIVGNHSLDHPDIMKLSIEEAKQNVLQAEEALLQEAGYRTALFRSPYGSIDPERIEEIEKLGYKIIAWNVDSLDWKSLSAEQVKYNILENVREGSIILQHSSGGKEENLSGSVSALGEVITILKNEGYEFVTIPELLGIPYQK